ncbi:hypothetical protein J437_LFUL006534 [Ladona fulva]|uniref:Death domain-containing protein n=1 Tax=Ladona fulva TaxID=123851 RepID=A0A8K0KG97_LADFU|nr:hypothetical protein J437_LFUL006534 [Ladona fulva]
MKNSSVGDMYHEIMESNCDSTVLNKKGFDSLKNSLEFEVNSARTLYYICDVKELMLVLKKRALPEAVEKTAFESILKFIKPTKCNEMRARPALNELPFPVMDLIATKIGHGWIDLSRYLDLPDYDIDEIETRYPNQLKQRAYQALLRFSREGRSGDEMRGKLLYALTKAENYCPADGPKLEID